MSTKRTKRGFTIIEVLVVLAIIAILGSLSILRYEDIQKKNRDVKRISDMREMQKALALYEATYQLYPVQDPPISITGTDAFSVVIEATEVISEVPTDPLAGFEYTYYSNDGYDYILTFCLETDTLINYTLGCGNYISP
jgi:general secretion pathway protein G